MVVVEFILEVCDCILHTIELLLVSALIGDDVGCAEDVVRFLHDVGALWRPMGA